MRNLIRKKVNDISIQTPNEILLLVDGFDVFIHTKEKEHILNTFLQFQSNIVIGTEGTSVWWQDALSRGIFGTCLGTYINSGCIIGYAHALDTLFNLWYENIHQQNNDQLLLSETCRRHESWFKKNVTIDTNMKLFATYPCALVKNHTLKDIIFHKKSLIIHGNGDCDMDQIIIENGLNIKNKKKRSHYLWQHGLHYASFYIKYVIVAILILIIMFVYIH